MIPPLDWQALLFVPLGAESTLRPNAVILDLEDAVAPGAKVSDGAVYRPNSPQRGYRCQSFDMACSAVSEQRHGYSPQFHSRWMAPFF
jgi:hypothetical protein